MKPYSIALIGLLSLTGISTASASSYVRCSTIVNGAVIEMGIFSGENLRDAIAKAGQRAQALGGGSVMCTPGKG